MIKIFFYLVFCFLSVSAVASQGSVNHGRKDIVQLPFIQESYRDDPFALSLVSSLLDIALCHKQNDPFRKGRAPGLPEMSLSRFPIAIWINLREEITDLLVVNWLGEAPKEFQLQKEWSEQFGSPVYICPNLEIARLAKEPGKYFFFDTAFGSESPISKLNMFPHMYPHDHYLIKALGKNYLYIANPYKKFLDRYWPIEGQPENIKSIILWTLVHEAYHVFEKNLQCELKETWGYEFYLPDDAAFKSAISDEQFIRLVVSYSKQIERIMNLSIDDNIVLSSPEILEILNQIRLHIDALTNNFPQAWIFYQHMEFVEGTADFFAGQSLIDHADLSYAEALQHLFADDANQAFYKTGALGHLFLRRYSLPVEWSLGDQGLRTGVWQKVINHATNTSQLSESTLELAQFDKTELNRTRELFWERFE